MVDLGYLIQLDGSNIVVKPDWANSPEAARAAISRYQKTGTARKP
jgi:hypothetical protein